MRKWDNGTKRCPTCRTTKPVSEFWKDRHNVDGLFNQCKPCGAKSHKKFIKANPTYAAAKMHKQALSRIGMTPEMYEECRVAQRGLCAICGNTNGNKKLAADHDHATNKFRGLLCDMCNRGLGLFLDSINRLEAAAAYLTNHRRREDAQEYARGHEGISREGTAQRVEDRPSGQEPKAGDCDRPVGTASDGETEPTKILSVNFEPPLNMVADRQLGISMRFVDQYDIEKDKDPTAPWIVPHRHQWLYDPPNDQMVCRYCGVVWTL